MNTKWAYKLDANGGATTVRPLFDHKALNLPRVGAVPPGAPQLDMEPGELFCITLDGAYPDKNLLSTQAYHTWRAEQQAALCSATVGEMALLETRILQLEGQIASLLGGK